MRKIRVISVAALLLPSAGWGQVSLNPDPSRVLGHARLALTSGSPNLVDARSLYVPQAVAVDTSASPPILYVADTGNHRVLAWRNAQDFANGAPADVVIGQRDMFSTIPLGPGTTFTSGLNQPTGLAVDSSGRLFVLDAGNNRVLRYPPPFGQPAGEPVLADLVIGQSNFNSRAANAGGASARTLSLTSTRGPFRTGALFDAQGNLWVTDAGNHRVLRYPAASVGSGASNGPAADRVLGQPDFTSISPLGVSAANLLVKDRMNAPSSLAFDNAGRLFVPDALNRVLVFAPDPPSGAAAARLIGIVVRAAGEPAPPVVNATALNEPQGVLVVNNFPLVIDSGNHRILRYDPVDLWPPETEARVSPAAQAVIGQNSLTSTTQARPNRGRPGIVGNGFSLPVQAAFAGGETFVVDAGNSRVLVFGDLSSGPQASESSPYEARRVLGQVGFDFGAPNLVEGREFWFNSTSFAGAGIAIDSRSSPPRLYVADSLNHRVLGFRDARRVRPGDSADVVIGQPDLFHSTANYPPTETAAPTASNLRLPSAVAVDPEGNLWVADLGNARVLRFRNPFANPAPLPAADLVLGQSDFTTRITDATSRTMSAPAGLAFAPDGVLAVADAAHHRVLVFRPPFTNGMSASLVIGQPDETTSSAGSSDNRFNGPRHAAIDSDGRLYVADSGNNRVSIFSNVSTLGRDPSPRILLTRLNGVLGVWVSPVTGEIWATDTRGGRVLRYPKFDTLFVQGDVSDANFRTGGAPLAVAQDPAGSLFIADSANRIAIHFPGLTATNAASGLPRLAPGMYATLRPVRDASFGEETAVFTEKDFPPMTRELGDVQVLLDEQPVPLHYVSPQQINAYLPMSAPTSGTVELQVVRASSGQILASSTVRMDVASPGLFTVNGSGTGQVAALNEDGSLNSASNPIPRGRVIQLFGTGQGFVPGAPPDGEPAAGQARTESLPRVLIGAAFVADSDVLYSGLAPGAVGLWQINVRVPERTAPGAAVQVVILQRDIPSNNPQNPSQIRTTIAVGQ